MVGLIRRLFVAAIFVVAGPLAVAALAPSWGTSSDIYGAHAPTDTLRIIEDQTVLAAVIRTTGIAAPFAPGHLIHAGHYEVALVLDPEHPKEASFRARISAPDLVVNDPELQDRLEERLIELGILDDPLEEMPDEDRESIRLSMLTEYQLNAEDHPWIALEAVEIQSDGEAHAQADPNGVKDAGEEKEFPWTVTGALTVRGVRVRAPLRARMEQEGSRIRIEGFGAFRFTELGIQPYNALLGAVRNRDEFYLYFHITAEPEEEPGNGAP